MRKNYMAEVAKLLGVELGEYFKITSDTQGDYPGDYQNYYRFTENNCLEISDDGVEWITTIATVLLKHILMGDVRIIKLPWKPKYDEEYYIPCISNAFGYIKFYWKGDDSDDKYYNLGLIFRSKEEAIALGQKMLAVAKENNE